MRTNAHLIENCETAIENLKEVWFDCWSEGDNRSADYVKDLIRQYKKAARYYRRFPCSHRKIDVA